MIFIFDTHPVHYRVPLWQSLSHERENKVKVIYSEDTITNGYVDKGFSKEVKWDVDLLGNYDHIFLNNRTKYNDWKSHSAKGIFSLLLHEKPNYVLLTGLKYRFDIAALLYSKLLGLRVGIRYETQDFAFKRSNLKSFLRKCFYNFMYLWIDDFYYIGELNRLHYLNHGVKTNSLFPSRYFTENRYSKLNGEGKELIRKTIRNKKTIKDNEVLIGFCGKLIDKKNPKIILEALKYIYHKNLEKITVYYIGTGELENELKEIAKIILSDFGVKCIFAGFINQSDLPNHYLAIDIFVLPSKKMGETWGLVVNEAIQAGCLVIVSSDVGCSADFGRFEKFGVFESGCAPSLAEKISSFLEIPRSFEVNSEFKNNYSLESAVKGILSNRNL